MSESRRAAHSGDTVGSIVIRFSNAISSRPSAIFRTRPDVAAARRLVAHYQPYNNTRIDAYAITRIEDGYTYSTPADLTIDGGYRFCPCLCDEADCTRVNA